MLRHALGGAMAHTRALAPAPGARAASANTGGASRRRVLVPKARPHGHVSPPLLRRAPMAARMPHDGLRHLHKPWTEGGDDGCTPPSGITVPWSDARLVAAAGAMTATVAASNYLVLIPINDWFTAGTLSYPITFLLTDVTNRRLGPRTADRV